MDRPIEQNAGLLHILHMSAGSSQHQFTRLSADINLVWRQRIQFVMFVYLIFGSSIGYQGFCIKVG